jgi:hypothetical protein
MASTATANVDYRLLDRLSNLVICSQCLRAGKVTPVPQVFSPRHTPHNVCSSCRSTSSEAGLSGKNGFRRKIVRFLKPRS